VCCTKANPVKEVHVLKATIYTAVHSHKAHQTYVWSGLKGVGWLTSMLTVIRPSFSACAILRKESLSWKALSGFFRIRFTDPSKWNGSRSFSPAGVGSADPRNLYYLGRYQFYRYQLQVPILTLPTMVKGITVMT
jgi:hypothetical protein